MDYKKYLQLDKTKIKKSLTKDTGLKQLSFLSDGIDPNDAVEIWYDMFTYNEKRSDLENFLLYKAAVKFELYTGIDDADITKPALEHLKNKLLMIEQVENVLVGVEIDKTEKSRVFKVELKNGKTLFLESDTANSLMIDLNDFMNIIIPKIKEIPKGTGWPEATYFKQFSLNPNKSDSYYTPYKYFYFYTLIDEIKKNLLDGIEKECFEALEKRASLVHTEGNLLLVPYGYNSPRGWGLATYKSNRRIKDRLDLTYLDWNEMIEDPAFTTEKLQQRLRNKKCSLDSVAFLLQHKEILLPNCPNYPPGVEKKSIEAILDRSIAILATL